MPSLINLWAKVKTSGEYFESYDPKSDSLDKLHVLVNSWKKMVQDQFSSEHVKNLYFYPCNGCFQIIYVNHPFEQVVRKCEVKSAKVGANLGKSPQEAFATIEIHAIDLTSREDFCYTQTVLSLRPQQFPLEI